MPWLFNPTRDVHPVELMDGSTYGFLPRKKVYIAPNKMSAAAWRLVRCGKLANQGGDPVAAPVKVSTAPKAAVQPAKLDTSSGHHPPGARVTVDSSNAFDGQKESKAVKKQTDDLKKATSGGPEVVIQSNDTSNKTEKRSKGSRRRS